MTRYDILLKKKPEPVTEPLRPPMPEVGSIVAVDGEGKIVLSKDRPDLLVFGYVIHNSSFFSGGDHLKDVITVACTNGIRQQQLEFEWPQQERQIVATKTSDEYYAESELSEDVKPIWQAGWLAAMQASRHVYEQV